MCAQIKAHFNYFPNPPGKKKKRNRSKFQHGISDRNDRDLLLVSHSNYPGKEVKEYAGSCQVNSMEIHSQESSLQNELPNQK